MHDCSNKVQTSRNALKQKAEENVAICSELGLNKGDIVRIHRYIDANWIEGERNGRIGIFPTSYVQV